MQNYIQYSADNCVCKYIYTLPLVFKVNMENLG